MKNLQYDYSDLSSPLENEKNQYSDLAMPFAENPEVYQNSIINNLKQVAPIAVNALGELPKNIWNVFAKQVPETLRSNKTGIDLIRDFLGGGARGLQNIGAAGLEAGEYLSRKGAEALGSVMGNPIEIPYWNAREAAGLGKENPVDLGKYIETEKPDLIASMLGQYGLGGASLGTKFLPFVTANTINSAIQVEPGHRLKGGIEGAVGSAIPLGTAKIVNSLRPSRLFAGELTPEQLQANLEAAEGTTTGLGDVVGSPRLKKLYENQLPAILFSGAERKMQSTGKQLLNRGESLIDEIESGLPAGDKNKLLQDALIKASNTALKEKNSNFQRVNKIADEEGLVVPRTNFSKKAHQIISEIEESPELKREFSPEFFKNLMEYATNEQGNNLKRSDIFKGILNDKATEFYLNNKKYEYGLMKQLKDALGTDIDEAIKGSGNKKLQKSHKKAFDEYISKYVQFEDPDITKFTRLGGDSDLLLSHFLRIGKNDRANLLEKVSTKLPEEQKNLLLSMYLSRAVEDGELNPMKLRTLYNKLGEKQKELLIPDTKTRKELKKYVRSIDLNTEAFDLMRNPKTGNRTHNTLAGGLQAILGGQYGGLEGALAATLIPGLVGKGAVNLLTSEKVRNSLVKSIIKQKKAKK